MQWIEKIVPALIFGLLGAGVISKLLWYIIVRNNKQNEKDRDDIKSDISDIKSDITKLYDSRGIILDRLKDLEKDRDYIKEELSDLKKDHRDNH